MKKNIIVLLLLVFLITICISEQIYIEKFFNHFEKEVNAIIAVYEEPNLCADKIDELICQWECKRGLLECSISHSDLLEIELLLYESKGNIYAGEVKNSLSTLIRLKETMKLTAHVLDFKWEHIC